MAIGEEQAEPRLEDDEVDAVIREFEGDTRAAIRALLHDLDTLARGYGTGVSRGYVRREVRVGRAPVQRDRSK